MKWNNQQLNSIKVFLVLVLCIIAVATLVFFIRGTKSKLEVVNKYNNVLPSQILSSDENLDTKLYFNNVLGEDKALDPVVEVINGAKHSVELAMFSFDSTKVKKALYDATNRGVQVTLILDSSRNIKHNRVFSDLPVSIKRIDVGNYDESISTNNIYMHHKLLIIDRGLDTEKMITGSMDYTAKGEKYEQSFLLVTGDKTLIKVYGQEFDLLKRGIHGEDKLKEKDYYPWAADIEYKDSYLDLWFSPGFEKNSVKYKIIESINKAEKNIDIIMWQFTDRSIADALINKSKEGIKVRIITDDLVADGPSSEITYIKGKIKEDNLKNIEVVLDTKSNSKLDLATLGDGFSAFIHHHFMTIDNSTVVFGTNNWSSWGFYSNDEDTIMTNNSYLVSEFQKTFDYFYKTLK